MGTLPSGISHVRLTLSWKTVGAYQGLSIDTALTRYLDYVG